MKQMLLGPGLSGLVVDGDAGLDVVAVDAEGDFVVLDGFGFQEHAGGDQVVPLKDGGDPVEDMVLREQDVVGDLVLEGEHAFHVQISGSGDQVLLIGVFAGELIADQIAILFVYIR